MKMSFNIQNLKIVDIQFLLFLCSGNFQLGRLSSN